LANFANALDKMGDTPIIVVVTDPLSDESLNAIKRPDGSHVLWNDLSTVTALAHTDKDNLIDFVSWEWVGDTPFIAVSRGLAESHDNRFIRFAMKDGYPVVCEMYTPYYPHVVYTLDLVGSNLAGGVYYYKRRIEPFPEDWINVPGSH